MSKYYVPTDGVESWRKLLTEPDKHWAAPCICTCGISASMHVKSGYSARSLAYCWEEAQGFPKRMHIE